MDASPRPRDWCSRDPYLEKLMNDDRGKKDGIGFVGVEPNYNFQSIRLVHR